MAKVAHYSITGQDGSYTAEFLLEKVEVHSISVVHRHSTPARGSIYQDPHTCNPKFICIMAIWQIPPTWRAFCVKCSPDRCTTGHNRSRCGFFESPNIPLTCRCCACWRRSLPRSGKPVLSGFTSELYGLVQKFPEESPPISTRALRMRSPNCTPTGSPLTSPQMQHAPARHSL